MKNIIGFTLCLIFLLIALIHFYWAFGGKWGKEEAIPTTKDGVKIMSPKTSDCLIVSILFIICISIILIKINIISLNMSMKVFNIILFGMAFIFALRAIGDFNYVGFFKKVKLTKFGVLDTKYYSPLCLLISTLCFLLQFIKWK